MANALVHTMEVEDWAVVETATQLRDLLHDLTDGFSNTACHDLEKSYVIATVTERLSDGSTIKSIRIREAETV